MTVSISKPEIEMDFVVPLKDVTVPEKKQAKFECTITKDVAKVMWYRGDDIITTDQKYDIIDDGKKHILVINCCQFEDEDEYTVAVLGKTSAARLTVEGKCVWSRQQSAIEPWPLPLGAWPHPRSSHPSHWYYSRYQAQIYLATNGPDGERRRHGSV